MPSNYPTDPMSPETSQVQPVVMPKGIALVLAAVCLLGSLFMFFIDPIIGVPMMTMGATVLVYGNRVKLCVLAMFLCGAAGFLLGISDGLEISYGLYMLVMGLIVVFSVTVLSKRLSQPTVFGLIGLITVALFIVDAVAAGLAGTTVWGEIATLPDELVSMFSSAGVISVGDTDSMKATFEFIVKLWPSFYFMDGAFTGGLVLTSFVFTRKRVDPKYRVKPFGTLDLSLHILWPFVAGLVFVALSFTSFQGAELCGIIGFNLILITRIFLFVQGLAVVTHLVERAHMGFVARLITYFLIISMEITFMVLSIVGLLDFWSNFRRLSRTEDKDGTEQDNQVGSR